jgi:hypothetical protein
MRVDNINEFNANEIFSMDRVSLPTSTKHIVRMAT